MTDSEDESKVEKLRKNRLERVREIKERKRKKKSASDIEDGEVDSEGMICLKIPKDLIRKLLYQFSQKIMTI